MKKVLNIAIILTGIIALSLAGCGTHGASSQSNNVSPVATQPDDASAHTFVSAGDGMYVSTETGIYEMQTVFAESANLMYADAKTNSRIFLCSQPNCTHNSENCQSYFATPGAMFPPMLFSAGEHLLVFKTESTDQNGPTLFCMNYDGSNRETILELAANQTLMGSIVTDGTQLYFDVLEIKTDGTANYLLLCADIMQKEYWEVCGLGNDETHYQLVGCTETGLVFVNTSDGNFRYYLVDPDAPDFGHPLLTADSSSLFGDGFVFSLDEQKNTVVRVDLQTHETVTAPYPHKENYQAPSMRYLYDGKVLVEEAGPVIDGKYDVSAYIVDPKSNISSELILRTPYNDRPVYVMGTVGEFVYVSTDYKLYTPAMPASDGTESDFDYVANQYAFMTKQDYETSNREGYQMVTDIFD